MASASNTYNHWVYIQGVRTKTVEICGFVYTPMRNILAPNN